MPSQAYPCTNGCGKVYNLYSTMIRHVQLDCGNYKKFSCIVCNKSFKRKYHLKRHYLTHLPTTKPIELFNQFNPLNQTLELGINQIPNVSEIEPHGQNIPELFEEYKNIDFNEFKNN